MVFYSEVLLKDKCYPVVFEFRVYSNIFSLRSMFSESKYSLSVSERRSLIRSFWIRFPLSFLPSLRPLVDSGTPI